MSLVKVASLLVLLFAPAVFADSEVANAAARRLECKADADTTKVVQEATTELISAGSDCTKLTAAYTKLKDALDKAGCAEEAQFKTQLDTMKTALESNGCDTTSGATSLRGSRLPVVGLVLLPLLVLLPIMSS